MSCFGFGGTGRGACPPGSDRDAYERGDAVPSVIVQACVLSAAR